MKLSEALKKQKEAQKIQLAKRKSKGHDYAKEKDCLTNFKEMAGVVGASNLAWSECPHCHGDISGQLILHSEGTAMFFVLHKALRAVNIMTKRDPPENESLTDTMRVDGPNYFELSLECYEDSMEEEKHKGGFRKAEKSE